MTRPEAIERIIWVLLARADTPSEAVAAAKAQLPYLGSRARLDFQNLLRAAGLFAFDDDGVFVRYSVPNGCSAPTEQVPAVSATPGPTHWLTVPVPLEPRMRVAYNVFAGLLLKHLYQRHGLVPLQVTEGMAIMWGPSSTVPPKSPLPNRTSDIWKEFQDSDLAREALRDGVAATFAALAGGRAIGALELPHSWKHTEVENLLRSAVDRHPECFQVQSKKDKLCFTKTPRRLKRTLAPFALLARDRVVEDINGANTEAGSRCLVCGQSGDMIQGGKLFLPENKKQWYEEPGPRDKFPKLCSTCAYVALLSGIVPSSDRSVVEFPADNFLEIFALHEHLQGISGAVALKAISRVATLSVLSSRYLLLSKTTKQGKMDSKTQVYSQLRNHTPLLRDLDRSMRVQIEGGQPNFWSEIHPHVAVGLSYYANFPSHFETGERKILAQRVTSALVDGRPFKALHYVVKAEEDKRGVAWERAVLSLGLRAFETEFVKNEPYAKKLAQALGGGNLDCNIYGDIIEFSNYLVDLLRPLVSREAKGGSAVSGIARKYTDLICRDFTDCRAAKFLYVVCQEVDSAERKNEGWAKRKSFERLYGEMPAVKDKSEEEAARLWDEFRRSHPRTVLETAIEQLHARHGQDAGIWSKFLNEVQARTLALLMLNVHNVGVR